MTCPHRVVPDGLSNASPTISGVTSLTSSSLAEPAESLPSIDAVNSSRVRCEAGRLVAMRLRLCGLVKARLLLLIRKGCTSWLRHEQDARNREAALAACRAVHPHRPVYRNAGRRDCNRVHRIGAKAIRICGVFYRLAESAKETRQTPVPVPPKLLSHVRRWYRKQIAINRFVETRRQPG
jgi:hypothetical protein